MAQPSLPLEEDLMMWLNFGAVFFQRLSLCCLILAVCMCGRLLWATEVPPFAPDARVTDEDVSTGEIIARASKGDADAQLKLGAMYTTGKGLPLDTTKAVIW